MFWLDIPGIFLTPWYGLLVHLVLLNVVLEQKPSVLAAGHRFSFFSPLPVGNKILFKRWGLNLFLFHDKSGSAFPKWIQRQQRHWTVTYSSPEMNNRLAAAQRIILYRLSKVYMVPNVQNL